MNFLDAANIGSVPVQSRAMNQTTIWLEEALFGHRLWARQTPWLLFLEFLNVADAFLREGKEELFSHTDPSVMRPYTMRYRMGLRRILFDNEEMARIANATFDDETKWRFWLDSMKGKGVDGGYEYLRQRFSKFKEFADIVALIRQTTLESHSNRRWSSRFIFPFGISALYSDAIVKGDEPQPDFNNFGRTGEILYMMLSRSRETQALRNRFVALLDPDLPKNQLVALLSPPGDDRTDRDQKGETYLPYRQHPAFDRLAGDWLSVLDLNLPEHDAFAHLVPLGSLHVMLYLLETSAALVGRVGRPHFICEMIAPRREFVRQRSIISYQDNDALSMLALESELERSTKDPEWMAVQGEELSDSERLDRALGFFERRFNFKEGKYQISGVSDLVEQVRRAMESKHETSCGRVHSDYARYIGLASRRGTNRMRYAPTDALLKTLVLTRVSKRMEFKRFLADLFEHYGFVFAEAEARQVLDTTAFDSSAFERNRARLEARLSSMGLLNRLSDGCAYVINPFFRQGA